MPATHVTDRPRAWSTFAHVKTFHEPFEHHAVTDDIVSILTIVACVMFLIGSVCFFSNMPEWAVYVGDYLFIIGSLINTAIAAYAMYECHYDMEAKVSKFQEIHDESDDSDSSDLDMDKERNEFHESTSYFFANVVFAAGAVLFYPELFENRRRREYAHEWGAWFFIIGSFGFVLAAYWNALGLSGQNASGPKPRSGSREAICARVATWELMLSMIGSQLFVVGSFLYRPSYDTHCDSRMDMGSFLQLQERLHREHLTHKLVSMIGRMPFRTPGSQVLQSVSTLCVNVTDQGTWMYVIGSGLFVVQSVLHLFRGFMMHGAVAEPAASGLLVSARRSTKRYTIV